MRFRYLLIAASLPGCVFLSGAIGADCGDGFIQERNDEGCDDGNNVDGDGCEANCLLPTCGDGSLDLGEECDDSNNDNGDGCEANCLLPTCGDGNLDLGEECDDSNNVDGDGCEANCTITPINLNCQNREVDSGELCINATQALTTGDEPNLLVVVDLNRDGGPEIITANIDSDDLSVFFLDERGFYVAGPVFTGALSEIAGLAAGDVNGDGFVDLAISNSNDIVSIFFGQGDGSFQQSSQDILAGNGVAGLILEDLDQDSQLDLAVALQAGDAVAVFFNEGSSFVPLTQPVGDSPVDVIARDFDRDGQFDLAVSNFADGTVSILLNDGARGFTALSDFPVEGAPTNLAVGDLDADGSLDLAVGNGALAATQFSVLFGDGNGAFALQSETANIAPITVSIANVDGDEDLDIVTTNFEADSLSLLRGNGSRSFAPQFEVVVSDGPNQVECVDINNDGLPEIIASHSLSDQVLIIPGQSGTVNTRPVVATDDGPVNAVIAELSGDNLPDLAVTNFASNSVIIFRANAGSLNFFTSVALTSPGGIAAGDFDSDGDSDLVVTLTATAQARILLNEGNSGIFALGALLATGNNPLQAEVADFDNDGSLDIATANSDANSLSVFFGNGLGSFTPQSFLAGGPAVDIVSGDFNGDGLLDLAVTLFLSNSLAIFIQNNNQSFTQPPNIVPGTGNLPQGLAVGDIDGDETLDIVVANSGPAENVVSFFTGNGDGSFDSPEIIPVNNRIGTVKVEDLNGDGNLDLVVTKFEADQVGVLLGDGAGNFEPILDFFTGDVPNASVIGDFNNDNAPDFVTVDFSADSLSLFFSAP